MKKIFTFLFNKKPLRYTQMIILLLCLILKNFTINGQVTKIWDKFNGTDGSDLFQSQAKTNDGGIIMCGLTGINNGTSFPGEETNDIYILKMKPDGSKDWDKRISGTNGEIAHSIKQVSDGGYIICGETGSSDGDITDSYSGGRRDILVVKLKSDGTKEWDKTFGGTNVEIAYSIIESQDKGFILCGHTLSKDGDVTNGNRGGLDLWIIKLNRNGSKIWDKTFGTIGDDRGHSIIQNSDGSYTICGNINNNGLFVWVIKITENGTLLWDKTFKSPSTLNSSAYESIKMIATLDNGYIITGLNSLRISNLNTTDLFVLKIDNLGNRLWDKNFGGREADIGWDIIQNIDGGYMISGETESIDGDITDGNNGSRDIWIIKLNSDGKKLWDKTFGGTLGEGTKASILQLSKTEYIVSTSAIFNTIDISSPKPGSFNFVSIKFEDGPLCSHKTTISSPQGKDICTGGNTTLIAKVTGNSEPYNFLWKQELKIAYVRDTVKINQIGKYILNVVDKNSCTAFAEIEIVQANSPISTITGTNNFCAGQNTTLTATATGGVAPITYQWKQGTSNIGTNANTLLATSAGTYSVGITDKNGCTGTSTAYTVTQKPSPNVTITKSGSTDLLPSSSVVLSVPTASGQTYQWSKNGVAIAGATNNSYTINSAGSYTVTVIGNGCSATSEAVVANIVTAIEEEPNSSEIQVEVSPNPTQEVCRVKIDLLKPLKVSLQLRDISGKSLQEQTLSNTNKHHETTLEFSNYPAGVYLLQVNVNDKRVVRKIIKQ